MSLHLVTAPASEPVTLAEAKAHLRVDTLNAEDTLIDTLVQTARETAEDRTKRALITQTWDLKLPCFPPAGWTYLPKAPLQSVTYIKYFDGSNVEQTLSTSLYQVDAPSGPKAEPGRIALAYGEVWPTTYGRLDAVTVRFVAGYGDAGSDVPARIRAGMLLYLGHLYANREAVVVGAIASELPEGVRRCWAGFDATTFGAAA